MKENIIVVTICHYSFVQPIECMGFPCGSTGKESACNAGDRGLDPSVGKIPWRRDRLPIPVFLGFPGSSAGKESVWKSGDLGSIPGSGKSPEEGKSYPLQYSGLENPMDCIVNGVTNSLTRLSGFHEHFQSTTKGSVIKSDSKGSQIYPV